MVTVAEAAAALGIDERTVREKLSKDEWKGEKRRIGMKEKWFMYRGELDRQIERLKITPKERPSTEGLDGFFAGEATDAETVESPAIEVQNERISIAIDEVLGKLTEQFSKQLNNEKEVVFTLRKELEDKERQLRLLPDLQRQAEEERKAAELKSLEAEALRKQIEAMQSVQEEAEEARRSAEEEIQRLKDEKEAETKAINDQLQALAATVLELQKPKPTWFQKWFLPKSE
jgi:chromosome segregation ATPase